MSKIKEETQEKYVSKKVDTKLVRLLSTKVDNGVVNFKQVYSNPIPMDERIKVVNSKTAADYLRALYCPDELELRESFFALYLNRRNEILGAYLVAVGSVSGCVVDCPAVVRGAVLCNASGVILCHNHPSGGLQPSENDKKTTANIKQALRFIDIALMDHIILGVGSYYSFTDEGAL